MKLLIVCQAVDQKHPNLGFFVRWIEEFSRHCESVSVIANEVGDHTLPSNVTVYSLGKEKGVRRLSRYKNFYSLLTSLRGKYDHVFCHMNPEFVIAGAPIWGYSGTPSILWYVHGSVTLRLRLALALSTAACTTDEKSLRVRSPKIHRVGHGIDTDFFVPTEHKNNLPLILSVSRIAPSKHIDVIIDAVMEASKTTPLEAKIIGGPGTKEDLEYVATIHKKVHDPVSFVGPQDHAFVHDAMTRADLFINASTTGSMDKVVLEAAASGVVPISSNLAFKAMLQPRGLFVEQLTDKAFAAAIVSTLSRTDTKELQAELREEVVKNHNLRQCVERILAVYEKP